MRQTYPLKRTQAKSTRASPLPNPTLHLAMVVGLGPRQPSPLPGRCANVHGTSLIAVGQTKSRDQQSARQAQDYLENPVKDVFGIIVRYYTDVNKEADATANAAASSSQDLGASSSGSRSLKGQDIVTGLRLALDRNRGTPLGARRAGYGCRGQVDLAIHRPGICSWHWQGG